MNRYLDANKLKAEIERRKEKYDPDYTNAGSELKELLSFINSLQQEQPEGGCSEKSNDLLSEPDVDLEKAARNVYESWMGGTMNDVRRDMVELGKVLNARKEEKLRPSLPSNLNEAAEAYEKYAMEDYDEICVNEDGSECPVLKCDFKDAFKAGAEWMAGQFQKIEGDLVDWYSTRDGKDYCCGVKTNEAFEVPEGFYIRKKQQPGESLKEKEDGNK